jgi:triosephosphate isomerase
VALSSVGDLIYGSPIVLGSQNCHNEKSGAYTGDISAQMLVDVGCEYVILGHSERRAVYKESNDLILSKVEAALTCGLNAVVCVGENLEQRDEEETLTVVESQVINSIPDGATAGNVIVAYEPVWAIGTGLTPTIDQITTVHEHLRSVLGMRFADSYEFRLLYGGSMNAGNAQEILSIKNVNGGLVGGASLQVDEFWSICMSV